jgi:stearoyl-CoA desaturase (Delta-9 desaturase)
MDLSFDTPAMSDTATAGSNFITRILSMLVNWFDADYRSEDLATLKARPDRIEWVRCIPFAILHGGCLGVFFTGWSWFAVGFAVFLYFVRMFAVTGFFHRYFSHRTFSTSRAWQFVLAVWGGACVQRGALWWAYTHRHHHAHSDEQEDKHSPRQHGFLWSHIGWITSSKNFPTDYRRIKDLAKYPELVYLNRFDTLIPILFAVAIFFLGHWLGKAFPQLGTNGFQLLVWGFFISTTFLFHGTACINSMAHVWGRKRYETGDDSRNSFLLSLITLGEGWHNNHHRHMGCVRQGFYWWEIDITYYLLKVMSWTGLIWDLRPIPNDAYDPAKQLPPDRRA